MFLIERLDSYNVHLLVEFLNQLRKNHWALTSLAYLPRPSSIPFVTSEQLIESEGQNTRVGTYILKCNGEIISVLQIDDKNGDGQVAIISGVETDPRFQRRGTCWRHLIKPCFSRICLPYFNRIEALTWVFNRKGIPLYKRIGFKAVPGTSLIMENYFPVILKHPVIRPFLKQYDVFRAFRSERSYGYDALVRNGVGIFEYRWEINDVQLLVYIDFAQKKIMEISFLDLKK